MIAIINASPLIYMGKIGSLQLFPIIFTHCYTTLLVKEEVLRKEQTPSFIALDAAFSGWLNIKEPSYSDLKQKLENMQIHSGEASIIALGKELKDNGMENVIIIDDLAAREIARTLELKITGTIGVILRAMRIELITKEKCREYVQALVENTDFRISATLYSKVLKEIEDF